MKNSLIFAGIIKKQISVVLIIPKLLPKVVLTIANTPRTLCAGSAKALTSFIFLGQKIFIYEEILTNKKGISNDYNSSLWSQMDNTGTN